jgi:chromosome segregation ATPase
MSDIVDRLRLGLYCPERGRYEVDDLLEEAAAEIERLQQDLTFSRSRQEHWFKEATTLRAEVEQYKSAAVMAEARLAVEMTETATLRAEVERKTHALNVAQAALADDASKAIKLTARGLVSHVLEHSTALAQEKQDVDG